MNYYVTKETSPGYEIPTWMNRIDMMGYEV